MNINTIRQLKGIGCDFDYNPRLLEEEVCGIPVEFVITYHNIFVGSNLSSFSEVIDRVADINRKRF